MRHRGSATSLQPDLFRPETWISAASATCSPATSLDTPSVISLLASAAGPTPAVLPDGPTSAPSGPARARASRSASRDGAAAPATHGICGPTSFASSVPPGPLSSWESRLRARLATVGSTEFSLIWRAKTTPAGALISRLAPWTPRISAAGSTGAPWPTPLSSPTKGGEDRETGTGNPCMARLMTATWPTPTVASATGGQSSRSGNRKDEPLMGGLMRGAAWATPRASDNVQGHETIAAIQDASSLGAWKLANRGATLSTEMTAFAAWVTPCARDGKDTALHPSVERRNSPQLASQMLAATAPTGPAPTGSPATTARRDVPNPAHPCWLMGYPGEWLCGGGSATPSSRRSRPK